MLKVANSDAVARKKNGELGRDEALGHVIAILASSGIDSCEDALLDGLIATMLVIFEEKVGAPESSTSTFHYGICMVLRGLWRASVPADLAQSFRRVVDAFQLDGCEHAL